MFTGKWWFLCHWRGIIRPFVCFDELYFCTVVLLHFSISSILIKMHFRKQKENFKSEFLKLHLVKNAICYRFKYSHTHLLGALMSNQLVFRHGFTQQKSILDRNVLVDWTCSKPDMVHVIIVLKGSLSVYSITVKTDIKS